MRRCVFLLALLACGDTRESKPADAHAKFVGAMDAAEAESNSILQDLKNKRGQESVVRRLDLVRRNLQSAEAVRIRKDPAEHEEMSRYFATFYAKLDQMRQADWTGEDGPRLWDKLQFQCSVCHGRFRE